MKKMISIILSVLMMVSVFGVVTVSAVQQVKNQVIH